jgi:multidrug efflux system membrane fusion protein
MTGLHHPGLGQRLMAATTAIALGLSACSKPAAKRDPPVVSVVVAPTKRTSVPYTIEANGIVTPMQTANVVSQVDGIIMAVPFTEGQEVARGQILFRIDARPYENAFNQAVAMLARDKATADNAQRQAVRYGTLSKDGSVTKEEAELQISTYQSALATVQADSALVATAKFNLDNTIVRAPISGRTGSVLLRTGNVVHAAGATPLVVINQVRPILVRFAVPSAQLPTVLKYGAKGGLPVSAVPGGAAPSNADTTSGPPMSTPDTKTAYPTGSPAQQKRAPGTVDGKLSFIDNAVDTTTSTIILKATFANGPGTLWAGQFVSTSLQLFVADNALVIPSQAVVTGQNGTYVYLVDSARTAQRQNVSVDRNVNGFAVITAGLSDGDVVVTEGQSRLTQGAKVVLRSSTNDTTSASGGRGKGRGGRGGGRGGRGGGATADTTAGAKTADSSGANAGAKTGGRGRGRGKSSP